MKTTTLPLLKINSLIKSLEEKLETSENLEFADVLQTLQEIFGPLIAEFEGCVVMPDLTINVPDDKECEEENKESNIDWEQRRFELIKAAMQGRISAMDKNMDFDSFKTSIARFSIKMADEQIERMKNFW